MKSYTIREASVKFGYSEMYIRRMLLEGKLEGEKDSDGVWKIAESALVEKSEKTTNDRAVRAYIVHIKSEDEKEVRAALMKLNIQLEPRFVYDEKRKAYNKKYREEHKRS